MSLLLLRDDLSDGLFRGRATEFVFGTLFQVDNSLTEAHHARQPPHVPRRSDTIEKQVNLVILIDEEVHHFLILDMKGVVISFYETQGGVVKVNGVLIVGVEPFLVKEKFII